LERQESAQDRSGLTFYASRFTFPVPRIADGVLLIVALIWGATFVMVKNAVATYPVLSFLALRFAFAALALLPVILWRRGRKRPNGEPLPSSLREGPSAARRAGGVQRHLHLHPPTGAVQVSNLSQAREIASSQKPLLAMTVATLTMGLALFAGYALQTFGLELTTPAKAGFITGLSVVIVPVVSTLLLRQRLARGAWLGVGLATIGLALLSLQADLSVDPGDLLVLGCALAFACQILLTGRFAPRHDPLLLTFGQIVVVAFLAGTAALLLESPPAPTRNVVFAAAFTGILATSLAFGIQTVAQRFTSPTRTALVFATEPVFAAIFSFLLIGEVLALRQLAGCALILAGMITSEILRNSISAK
jgi:drug/metabolite transporter (DMT)-like permease